MINKISILIVLLTLCSCRNFDSDKYIDNENKAINDIIHQMINYQERVKMNKIDTNDLKLYIIRTLDIEICEIYEPEGFIISESGNKLPEKEIKDGKRIYEEELEKFNKEQKQFSPLKDGTLKKRILDYKFEFVDLEVELISESPQEFNLNENEFGYLHISRIIFNKSFDKGYLSFSFYCGEGCFWTNNIEIIKADDKWKISKYLSGGIA